nr:MAG TPA: hypothetical protein [Caudoviricetes sp.]
MIEGLDVGNFNAHGIAGAVAHDQQHEALFGHLVHGAGFALPVGVFAQSKFGLAKFFRYLGDNFLNIAHNVEMFEAEGGGHFAAVGFEFAPLGKNGGGNGQQDEGHDNFLVLGMRAVQIWIGLYAGLALRFQAACANIAPSHS